MSTTSLEVTLCHAPHDGIKPAVLVQLGSKGPQVGVNNIGGGFKYTETSALFKALNRTLPRSTCSTHQRAFQGWCWSTRYGQALPWQASSASGLAAL